MMQGRPEPECGRGEWDRVVLEDTLKNENGKAVGMAVRTG